MKTFVRMSKNYKRRNSEVNIYSTS